MHGRDRTETQTFRPQIWFFFTQQLFIKDQPHVKYWIRPGMSFCTHTKIRYSVHSITEVLVALKTIYSRGTYRVRGTHKVLWSSRGSGERRPHRGVRAGFSLDWQIQVPQKQLDKIFFLCLLTACYIMYLSIFNSSSSPIYLGLRVFLREGLLGNTWILHVHLLQHDPFYKHVQMLSP